MRKVNKFNMRSGVHIIFKGILLTLLLLVTHCKPDKDELTPYYHDHSQLLMFLDDKGNMHPVCTPEDWQCRRNHILYGMQEVMGKLPDRKQLRVLDVQEMERLKGDGYTRLKISLVAEKGERSPAYLYVPDKHETLQRFPAILALHPTSPLRKGVVAGLSDKLNRSYAIEMAKRGYIVIAPD